MNEDILIKYIMILNPHDMIHIDRTTSMLTQDTMTYY